MPAKFLGLKLLGSDSSKAVATWGINVNTNDTQPAGGAPIQIPGQVAYYAGAFAAGFQYLLDIQSIRGNYDFGVIKRARISLTHSRAYEDGNEDFYIPGRVWIYIPSTGEVFVYASRDCMVFGSAAFAVTPEKVIETINDTIDLELPPNTQVFVVIESDSDTGGGIVVPDASINISLYNF